jgi:hypothetical protein
VNFVLSFCDLDTPLDGLLPHANTICVITYITQEAHYWRQAIREEDGEEKEKHAQTSGQTGAPESSPDQISAPESLPDQTGTPKPNQHIPE